MAKKVLRAVLIVLAAVLLAATVSIAGAKETKAWDHSNNVIWNGRNWVAYKNGKFAQWYTGIADNQFGWWRVVKGVVDFKYTGPANNEYGWFYIRNGAVDWQFTGFARGADKRWYFFRNGVLDWGYYELAQGPDGNWYYANGGYVDWNVTGLAYHNGGWFYVDHGKVNWKANTLCQNGNGWWKVTNGIVDFAFTGFSLYKGTWYYLRNGQIDWSYYGIAQGPDGRWYFVNGGYIDWNVSGSAIYNGQYWTVKKGVVTGLDTSKTNNNAWQGRSRTAFAQGGWRYLSEFFGVSRTRFVNYMMTAEQKHNYRYYLGTPFRGLGSWELAHNLFYTNAHPRSDGFAAMNCASFIAVATRDAGCNLNPVYPYSRLQGNAAYIGLAHADSWYRFLTSSGIAWRGYSSKQALLADGWAQRGDIIYCRPDYEHGAGGSIHIGFYWGSYPGEDYMWHSITYKYLDQYGNRLGNLIGPLAAPTACNWYVFKWDAS